MKQTAFDIEEEVARTKLSLDDDVVPMGPYDGLVLAGTGHRPEKLGGHTEVARQKLVAFARDQLAHYNRNGSIGKVVSGMALGWDQALAEAAVALDIPVLAAVPCEGQDSTWPPHARRRYREFLEQRGVTVHVVCPGPYKPWKMQVRNEWMCDRAQYLLGLWDGTDGGTANCMRYAFKKMERGPGPVPRIANCWAEWEDWNRSRR